MSGKFFRVTADNNDHLRLKLREQIHSNSTHKPCLRKSRHSFACLYQNNDQLKEDLEVHLNSAVKDQRQTKLCILFTGQGSQYPQMGKNAYDDCKIIKETLRRYQDKIRSFTKTDYLDCLLSSDEIIHQTQYTQTCIVMLQMALADLWRKLGIEADHYIGHSVGELSAFFCNGLYSEYDTLKLIIRRATLMQNLKTSGQMIAIATNKKNIDELIKQSSVQLDYAAFNSPTQTVMSGKNEEIKKIQQLCKEHKIKSRVLSVSHPFHSQLMKPIIKEFNDFTKSININKTNRKGTLISNLDGEELTGEKITSDYLSKHILQPVDFLKSIQTSHKMGADIFLEIGPEGILTPLAKKALPEFRSLTFANSMSKKSKFLSSIFKAMILLDNRGKKVNWDTFKDAFSLEIESDTEIYS